MRILLLLFLSFLFAGCPCPESVEGERFLLEEADLTFFKYQLGETIPFAHSEGLEFDFMVNEINEELEQTFFDECGGSFSSYETLNYTINSTNPLLSIDISIFATGGFNSSIIEINKTSFSFNRTDEPDHTSINLATGTFTMVYELESSFQDETEIQIDKVFFNQEHGILQINLSNEQTFSLLN